jgi:hypothetical protein
MKCNATMNLLEVETEKMVHAWRTGDGSEGPLAAEYITIF